jgi:hypothetical protein
MIFAFCLSKNYDLSILSMDGRVFDRVGHSTDLPVLMPTSAGMAVKTFVNPDSHEYLNLQIRTICFLLTFI